MSGKHTVTDTVQNTSTPIECIDLEEQPQTSQSAADVNTANETNPININTNALNFLNEAIKKALEAQELLNNAVQQLQANVGNTGRTPETEPRDNNVQFQNHDQQFRGRGKNREEGNVYNERNSSASSTDSDYEVIANLYNNLRRRRAKKQHHHHLHHRVSPPKPHRRSRSRSRERSHRHQLPIAQRLSYGCTCSRFRHHVNN